MSTKFTMEKDPRRLRRAKDVYVEQQDVFKKESVLQNGKVCMKKKTKGMNEVHEDKN